jgi:hypothetical protein
MNIEPKFREVTKQEFFRLLVATKKDIMPTIFNDPYYSDWQGPGRVLFGRTWPGWKNPSGIKKYAVVVSE